MFSNPEKNISQLRLEEGMSVADLGAGSGFYVKALSKKVGTSGRVYAVEVQKDMVKRLESEMKAAHLSNVVCVWGDIEKVGGTKIADESVHAVILSNVLFQVEDKLGLIDEAKRIVKKGGKVLLVDWMDSYGGMGPAVHHVVTKERAEELFTKRGFITSEVISVLDHHYGIIFTRNE